MKKIALLHYAYPPNIGGVERLIADQAKVLSEIGYDVSVFVGNGEEEKHNISFHQVPEFQSVLRTNPLLQKKIVEQGIVDDDFFTLAGKIGSLLDFYLKDIDTIIVHNMLTLIHNLPFIFAFKDYVKRHKEKKVIIWVHDQTFIDDQKIFWEKKNVHLGKESQDLLLTPIADAIYVVISNTFNQLLQQVMQFRKDQIRVIPNGIDIKRFIEIETEIWKFIQRHEIFDAFPIVLSPTNIIPRKNIHYGLEIVAELAGRYPKIRYVITGLPLVHRDTSEYFGRLKEKIKQNALEKNVIFLSEEFNRSLLEGELHDLYDISDVIFYFSKQENFGLPLLDAALTKTPIFVSNLPVFHEIMGNSLSVIDPETTTSVKAASIVCQHLETNPIIQMNRIARQKYNLETITKEKLVPLL